MDKWIGDYSLATKFPRLFALEKVKNCLVKERIGDHVYNWDWRRQIRSGCEYEQLNNICNILPDKLVVNNDTWSWHFNSKAGFIVAHLRKLIDHHAGRSQLYSKSRWNSYVPKKVNLFIWRLLRDSIPTFANLWYRGVDVNTIRCIQCSSGIDMTAHLFQDCGVLIETRNKLSNWLGKGIPLGDPKAVLSWLDGLQISRKSFKVMEGILFVWWWSIWKARNNCVHNNIMPVSDEVFNSIMSTAFLWMHSRDKKSKLDWGTWKVKPLSD